MSRSLCFTLFEEPKWNEIRNDFRVRYLVCQKEKCPNTQKVHYQGYVEFRQTMRISGAKKIIGEGHYEKRMGNRDSAREYCMKNESKIEGPWEFGEWISGQGHRSDISACVSMINKGQEDYNVLLEYPDTFVKYHNGLNKARFLIEQKMAQKFRNIEVWVYYGEPGLGKTKKVYDINGYENVFKVSGDQDLWFDGYNAHKVLLIDDFYGSKCKLGWLLQVLDGYPLRLPTKGGFRWALYDKVYITSNMKPCEWYSYNTEALHRRIKGIINFNLICNV